MSYIMAILFRAYFVLCTIDPIIIILMWTQLFCVLLFSALFLLLLTILFCCSCCHILLPTQVFFSLITPLMSLLNINNYDKQYPSESKPLNTQCFLCLEQVSLQVVTTCNHSFCGTCISSFIAARANQRLACPACRQTICILLRKFKTDAHPDAKAVQQTLSDYNSRHSTEPSFLRSLKEIGNVLPYLPMLLSREGIAFLMSSPRITNIALLLTYILSPIDLLPEAVLGVFGLLDDGVAALNIARQISTLLIDFVTHQARNNA